MAECCFTSTETIGLVRDGEKEGVWRWLMAECCFTSTETIGLVRDGEPRTATSTFAQLLTSVLWVHSVLMLMIMTMVMIAFIQRYSPLSVEQTHCARV